MTDSNESKLDTHQSAEVPTKSRREAEITKDLWGTARTSDSRNQEVKVQERPANNSIDSQLETLDKQLHKKGGPLEHRDDLKLVGIDSNKCLMLAQLANDGTETRRMLVDDDGKVVAIKEPGSQKWDYGNNENSRKDTTPSSNEDNLDLRKDTNEVLEVAQRPERRLPIVNLVERNNALEQTVRASLEEIPEQLRNYVMDRIGIDVVVAKNMAQYDEYAKSKNLMDMATTPARGDYGRTYEQPEGIFDPRDRAHNLVMVEVNKMGPVRQEDSQRVAKHEFGHAVDYALFGKNTELAYRILERLSEGKRKPHHHV